MYDEFLESQRVAERARRRRAVRTMSASFLLTVAAVALAAVWWQGHLPIGHIFTNPIERAAARRRVARGDTGATDHPPNEVSSRGWQPSAMRPHTAPILITAGLVKWSIEAAGNQPSETTAQAFIVPRAHRSEGNGREPKRPCSSPAATASRGGPSGLQLPNDPMLMRERICRGKPVRWRSRVASAWRAP